MNRMETGKNCGLQGAKTDRFLHKKQQKIEKIYETSKGDFLVQIHTQNRQKSVTPKKQKQKSKHLKPKKIRFLTEEIEKSANDWLSIPLKSGTKASLKMSSEKEHLENAYELGRTFKKHKKQMEDKKKSRKHSEQIEVIPFQLAPLTKIKRRNHKTHSLSSNKCDLHKITPIKLFKGNCKKKLLPKTDRNSHATPEPKQFLSPEMMKQQKSYCFQSQHGESHKKETKTNHTDEKNSEDYLLIPPKKNSLFLFDSEISAFKQASPSELLRSTVDLLN